jgi:hypothetical protein
MVTGISFSIEPDSPINSIVVVPVGALREALHVMVTVALPFAGTFTGFSVAVAETPLGNSFTLNVTDPWKPSTLVRVRVVFTLPSSSIVNDEGDSDMVKFGELDACTVSEIVVLFDVEPEVPVIVTVAVPTVALEEAVSVKVKVALPFAGGVTGLVEKDAVTPLGSPLALSVVAESKPPVLVMVIVLVPLLP